jgi:hypothetical protein
VFLKQNFMDLRYNDKRYKSKTEDIKNSIFSSYGEPKQKWARLFCEVCAIEDNNNYLPEDSYITHDNHTKRVYSAFIKQSKQLRPFFELHGEQLAEIDVSACYAYLLNLFYSHPAFKSVTDRFSPEQIQKEQDHYSSPWRTQNVDFYEFLGSLMPSETYSRAQIKVGFNQKFVTVKHTNKLGDAIKNVFETNFPILLQILNHIKKTYILDKFGVAGECEQKSAEKLHAQVAIILMQLESTVMIDKVAQNAMDNHKFIVTIHDGILVEQNDVDYFQTLISEEFEKIVGLPPRLKVQLPECDPC